MKLQLELRATAQAINMAHQIYIVGQMNVCSGRPLQSTYLLSVLPSP